MEYRHFYRIDENGIVILAFSEAFEQPQEGDFFVEWGARAFNPNIYNSRYQFALKLEDGAIVERTQVELDAEWDAIQAALPETDAQKLVRLDAQMTQINADFAAFLDFYFTQNPDQQ